MMAKSVNLFRINLHDRYLRGRMKRRHQFSESATSVLRFTWKFFFLIIELNKFTAIQNGVLLSRIYLPSGDKDLYALYCMMHTA